MAIDEKILQEELTTLKSDFDKTKKTNWKHWKRSYRYEK